MRVLLATDGSKDAQAALAFLQALPLPPSSMVRIAIVVTLPSLAFDMPPAKEFESSALEAARGVLEEARTRLGGGGLTTEADVAIGDPKSEIIRIAEEWGADLLVLGARGLSRFKRFLLGSVSLSVARHAPCPVLVVKGRPRKLGSVLVATDGSEDSFRAIRFLQSLPLPRQTRLRLLGVVEPLRYPVSAPKVLRGQLVAMIREVESRRRGELEKVLERAAAQLDQKITRVTRATPTGDPASTIVATAAAHDVDLIVVGARGRGGMERLLLGSVSESVLGHAQCAILIVKDRPKA